jgi:microcystin-dependent protein
MTVPGMPAGSIVAFGGAVAPTCWLLCDGTSYLRTAWPELFAVIGTAYGAADGTHFNVPDLRGRSPVGVSPGLPVPRPTVRTRGQVGGEEAHTLVLTEMAAHDHGGVTGAAPPQKDLDRYGYDDGPYFTANGGTHTHSIASAGGDVAHNTMQPFQVTEFIIKT